MVNTIQDDFKTYLYSNERDIKTRLYDKHFEHFNKKELDYLHKILVKWYVSKRKINPFSDGYCSLCSEETKRNVVLPFLEKEDTFLRYDVIRQVSTNHLTYFNLVWALEYHDIDLKEFIFKLCKDGGYIKPRLYLTEDNVYRLDIIKCGKWFFGLFDYEMRICALEFYKQPWGIQDYTNVTKVEVLKFVADNQSEQLMPITVGRI